MLSIGTRFPEQEEQLPAESQVRQSVIRQVLHAVPKRFGLESESRQTAHTLSELQLTQNESSQSLHLVLATLGKYPLEHAEQTLGESQLSQLERVQATQALPRRLGFLPDVHC